MGEMVRNKQTRYVRKTTRRTVTCENGQRATIIKQKHCHKVLYRQCKAVGAKERYKNKRLALNGGFSLCDNVITAHCVGEDNMIGKWKIDGDLGDHEIPLKNTAPDGSLRRSQSKTSVEDDNLGLG